MKRLIWILCKHGRWRIAYFLNPSLAHSYATIGQFITFKEDKP
jgi:hypothetical protein